MRPTVIRPAKFDFSLGLKDLPRYRDLLIFMTWREIAVRYKQTALGAAWLLLQPMASTLVLTVVFSFILDADSEGVPYPLFALSGLVVWNTFAYSLRRIAGGFVSNADLLRKVYFPRVILPMAYAASGLVDFLISFLLLIAVIAYYGVSVGPELALVPVAALLATLNAIAFGLWLASFNVRFRDIQFVAPFIIQLGMFLTPVAYSFSQLPEAIQLLGYVNPMAYAVNLSRAGIGAEVLEGALTGLQGLVQLGITLVALLSGLVFFSATERSFADIA